MKKNLVRLTESDLHRIIKESVKRIINEVGNTPEGQRQLGRLANRKFNQAAAKSLVRPYDEPSVKSAYDEFYDVDNYAERQRLKNGLDDDEYLDGYGDRSNNNYLLYDKPNRHQPRQPEGGTGYYG